MGILSKKINDYNDLGKDVKDPKESVDIALDTYSEMKPALAKAEQQKKKNAKPKMFKVDIKPEPKKETSQSTINVFGPGTVVENFEDIGMTSTPAKKKSDDMDMELASINGGKPVFQLKVVDHSNLYKVEESNVLKLNPFQINFSENELNQYTYQNPMLGQYNNGLTKDSF